MSEFLDGLKDSNGVVKVCAPMVRYSKLPFRLLVQEFGCDLAFSPMIMSESFAVSPKAQKNEFSTSTKEKGLIVQFAANQVYDFVRSDTIFDKTKPVSDASPMHCQCVPNACSMRLQHVPNALPMCSQCVPKTRPMRL